MTLRAVARQVGIAAPSIYGHFANRDEILLAVIADAFAELDSTLVQALEAQDDKLRAVCAAYLEFARSRPHRYRVMFGRHRSDPGGNVNQQRPDTDSLVGSDAFGRLMEAVARGAAHVPAEDLMPTATSVWVALHGYVSLRDSVPAFPWPPEEEFAERLITRLTST